MNQLELLTDSFSLLEINESKVIQIQKWFRGCILRLKRLPLIMYKVQKYLISQKLEFSRKTDDGRINSCMDESEIIDSLIKKFGNKIIKAKKRMWYDILAFDYIYGWIPINIKTTTTTTCDNIGNLAMCVYSYTNEMLDIKRDKTYDNGEMAKILTDKLKKKEYNNNSKKDYYFIVLNKNNSNDIIVNSLKGLTILKPNINNLPFQVCWNKNREFKYQNINTIVETFIECLKKPEPSWRETFMAEIRNL